MDEYLSEDVDRNGNQSPDSSIHYYDISDRINRPNQEHEKGYQPNPPRCFTNYHRPMFTAIPLGRDPQNQQQQLLSPNLSHLSLSLLVHLITPPPKWTRKSQHQAQLPLQQDLRLLLHLPLLEVSRLPQLRLSTLLRLHLQEPTLLRIHHSTKRRLRSGPGDILRTQLRTLALEHLSSWRPQADGISHSVTRHRTCNKPNSNSNIGPTIQASFQAQMSPRSPWWSGASHYRSNPPLQAPQVYTVEPAYIMPQAMYYQAPAPAPTTAPVYYYAAGAPTYYYC
ncbi:hypothetical protein F4678DRAFT_486550 [Xylaria arbuscula]|nr:hypothetical protein F4678DRAFT_486550 [Xylaria arbuscula]